MDQNPENHYPGLLTSLTPLGKEEVAKALAFAMNCACSLDMAADCLKYGNKCEVDLVIASIAANDRSGTGISILVDYADTMSDQVVAAMSDAIMLRLRVVPDRPIVVAIALGLMKYLEVASPLGYISDETYQVAYDAAHALLAEAPIEMSPICDRIMTLPREKSAVPA